MFIGALLGALLAACSPSSNGPPANSAGAAGQAGASAMPQAGAGASAGATAPGGSAGASGGSAGSAGTAGSAGDAGGTAGSGGVGTAGAGGCGALFCDDFEAATLGKVPGAPWTTNMSGGTIAVDATHVHSGKQAVKIAAAAATGYRSAMLNLQKTPFLPTASKVVYGRMLFWLDSAPKTSVHWTFIDAVGKVPGQAYRAYYRYGGQSPITSGTTFVGSELMANYDTPDSYATPAVGPSTDCWLHADKVVVPVGKWSCAEWKFDGVANKMQFWLDGAEVPSLAMNGMGQGCVNQSAPYTWAAPSFDRVDIGWESYQADDARNMWIDDVAIGADKLGCPQ